MTDTLVQEGREASARRVVLLGLQVSWPFESRERYRDVLGRLGELGIDEVVVHRPRPDGRGLPAAARPMVLDAHDR